MSDDLKTNRICQPTKDNHPTRIFGIHMCKLCSTVHTLRIETPNVYGKIINERASSHLKIYHKRRKKNVFK